MSDIFDTLGAAGDVFDSISQEPEGDVFDTLGEDVFDTLEPEPAAQKWATDTTLDPGDFTGPMNEWDSPETLERAQAIRPDQPPEKTVLSYAPYMAVSALKGAMGPLLSPLKTMGMDSEGVLNTAIEYWKGQLPEVGVPNAGIVFDEKGDLDIQRLDDVPISEIVGATAEGVGFLAPATGALKAGGLVAAKAAKYARPFFQSILKGMVGGALLGEGKKDETLAHMAMFGVFEGAGYAVGKVPDLVKNVKNSAMYRKATIKERGLVIQNLEETIRKNPEMAEADLVKQSDTYFKEAMAKRRDVPEPKVEPKAMDTQVLSKIESALTEGSITKTDAMDLVKIPRLSHLTPQVEELIAAKGPAVTPKPKAPVEAIEPKVPIGVFPNDAPIEQHMKKKYKELYAAEESNLPHRDYQTIVDGRRKPETLGKLIEKAPDRADYIKQTKAAIADLLGDLEETYKYEGQVDGQTKERYVDSLLKTIEISEKPLPDKKPKPKVDKIPGKIPDDTGVEPELKPIDIEREFGTGKAVTKEERRKATDKFIDETFGDRRIADVDRRTDIAERKRRDAIKEPWEMSQTEYLEENRLGGSELFNQWIKATGKAGRSQADKNQISKYRDALTSQLENKHKKLVQKAISEGKIKSHPDYPKPKAPSGYADTGGYTDVGGQAAPLKSVLELPEIVGMAKDLMGGRYPSIIEKIRVAGGKALGAFYPKGTGDIKLRADIFKDPALANYVLAHEIGHLVDYLPDKSMAKGNILGRMASLKGYMKHSLPNQKGAPGELTSQDRVRYRYQAKKAVEAKGTDVWIDEIIRKEFPITPDDVMAIWRSTEGGIDKGLLDYVKGLNRAQKKAVMKDALKGMVGAELQQFAKSIETPTGKKIKQTISDTAAAELIKQKYTDLVNKELEKRKLFDLHDITKELKALTLAWKPFDPKADPKYTKYRFSPEELYADAFSVLINKPGMLKSTAPKFYEGFFNYLESKPALKKEYENLQRDISSGAVEKNRTQNVYDMFAKGDEAYALSVKKDSRFKESLTRELFDAHWSIIRKVREIDPAKIRPEENPVYAIEDMTYTGSELEWYLKTATNRIIKPLEDVDLNWDDFGFELFLKRVATERAEMGNPMGWTPKLAKEKLEAMKQHRTTDQNKAMAEAGKEFKKLRTYTIDKADKTNRWDPEMIKVMRESKDYATFDVIKYIEKRLGKGPSASISKQIGTLQEIANPATATILKDMAIIKAVNRMTAMESTVDFLSKHFPDDIKVAKKSWNGRAWVLKDPPAASGQKLIAYLKNGKPKGYYVDSFIADSFMGNPWEAQAIGKVFQALGQPFRTVFTEANPGFWMFNIYRDFFRAAGNLPKAGILNFAADYAKALKPAFKSAYGISDPVIQEMLQGNMLISIADYRGENVADKEIERLLKRYHMTPKAWNNFIIRPFGNFFTYYTNIGRGLERTTKIAGYTYLKRRFPDMPEAELRHMVRNVGSPDFLRKGRAYPIYNNILLFSNAIKEGYRGDVEAFAASKAEWAWKKTKYAILPKLLLKAGTAGLLGVGVKAILDGVSEYDKTNYHIIPIGLTPGGKSIYLRVPIDETGRMIGGVFWKLLNMDEDKFLTGLMDYMSGQAPTVNPAIDSMLDIVEYASGRNPYDSFRDRRAVPEQVFEAGGKQSHVEFMKYLYNKSGGGIVYKFKYDDVDKIKTELEEILGYPIASNIIGRFIKVSDQGLKEGIRKDVTKVRQLKTKEALAAKEAAYKLIRGEDLTDAEYDAMAKKPKALDRNLLIALSKKTGTIFAEAMLRAQSKEEKALIFDQWVQREKLLKKASK